MSDDKREVSDIQHAANLFGMLIFYSAWKHYHESGGDNSDHPILPEDQPWMLSLKREEMKDAVTELFKMFPEQASVMLARATLLARELELEVGAESK